MVLATLFFSLLRLKNQKGKNMRVLTHREREAFEMAYKCISRVVAVTYTTEKLYEVKVQNSETRQSTKLPTILLDMFHKAGFVYMQKMFCDINKEEMIELLIKKFFKDGIQPKEYCFFGLLFIEPIVYQETTFIDASRGVE